VGYNSQIAGLGEVEDKTEMYQRGMKYEEARQKLLNLLGENSEVILKNDHDGEKVRLSRSSVGKLVSNTAVGKSEQNGFTRAQHYAVVSDINNLFKASFKLWERPDKDGEVGIFIHRFAAPLNFGEAVAYITVKESRQHGGKRIYTAELIKIGKLGGILEEAQANAPTHFPSPSFNESNICKLFAAVYSEKGAAKY